MEVVETIEAQGAPAAPLPETKWYVLRVVSGKERKVKEYLDKDLVRNGWTETIKQIFLPMEKGLKFAIREGGRTVGAGQVTEILK